MQLRRWARPGLIVAACQKRTGFNKAGKPHAPIAIEFCLVAVVWKAGYYLLLMFNLTDFSPAVAGCTGVSAIACPSGDLGPHEPRGLVSPDTSV